MKDIKYRQYLKPPYQNEVEKFHYWGYIDDGFVAPVGKNISDQKGDQYTGLKDKNGVEIYEGDIFWNGDLGFYPVEVKYDHEIHGFVLKSRGGKDPLVSCNDEGYELWGNIHENPELLEVVK